MFMEQKEKVYPVAKQAAIMHLPSQRLVKYDPDKQELFLSGDGSYTVFPSKQRAISARHHGIANQKARGAVEQWKEIYQVVEL